MKDAQQLYHEVLALEFLEHLDCHFPEVAVAMLNKAQQRSLSRIMEATGGRAGRMLAAVCAEWRRFTKRCEDRGETSSPRVPSLTYVYRHLDEALQFAQDVRAFAGDETDEAEKAA